MSTDRQLKKKLNHIRQTLLTMHAKNVINRYLSQSPWHETIPVRNKMHRLVELNYMRFCHLGPD